MYSHSILVSTLVKLQTKIGHWYEFSLLHHLLSKWAIFWEKLRKSSKVLAWGSLFFNLLQKSKVYELLKLLIQGINTLILWSYERLVNFNSKSVLLQTINNFGIAETKKMSFALVCGGFGFGLLVNFILKRQVQALIGLLPLAILVFLLVGIRLNKLNFKGSILYRISKRGAELVHLDQEEV